MDFSSSAELVAVLRAKAANHCTDLQKWQGFIKAFFADMHAVPRSMRFAVFCVLRQWLRDAPLETDVLVHIAVWSFVQYLEFSFKQTWEVAADSCFLIPLTEAQVELNIKRVAPVCKECVEFIYSMTNSPAE